MIGLMAFLLSCEKEKVVPEITKADYLCAGTWYEKANVMTFYQNDTVNYNGYKSSWQLHEGGKYFTTNNYTAQRQLIIKLDADSFVYHNEFSSNTIHRWSHKL